MIISIPLGRFLGQENNSFPYAICLAALAVKRRKKPRNHVGEQAMSDEFEELYEMSKDDRRSRMIVGSEVRIYYWGC
jgi:hypothetical protein